MTDLEPGREEAEVVAVAREEAEAEVVAVAKDRVSEEKREAEVVAVAAKKRGREAEAKAEAEAVESSKKLEISQDKVSVKEASAELSEKMNEYRKPRTCRPDRRGKPRDSAPTKIPSPSIERVNTHIGTPNWGDDPSPEARKLMEAALKSYNDQCARRAMNKPEAYSLVEYDFTGGLHINAFVNDGIWFHLNFQANIKIDKSQSNSSNYGPYLIFAELRRTHGQAEYEVVICENLGPVEVVHVPRLNGCRACDIAPHRDILVHGRKGFNVGITTEFR